MLKATLTISFWMLKAIPDRSSLFLLSLGSSFCDGKHQMFRDHSKPGGPYVCSFLLLKCFCWLLHFCVHQVAKEIQACHTGSTQWLASWFMWSRLCIGSAGESCFPRSDVFFFFKQKTAYEMGQELRNLDASNNYKRTKQALIGVYLHHCSLPQ